MHATRQLPTVHHRPFRPPRPPHLPPPAATSPSDPLPVSPSPGAAAAAASGWQLDSPPAPSRKGGTLMDLPLTAVRRPLAKVRANDSAKVEALMASIAEVGLKEPIDVLECDGKFYGFSGCHRFEACE